MNFKRCTSLFAAFLLLVSNTGLAFNVHYCGDKIASIKSVFDSENVCAMEIPVETACCAKKIVETKNKCCSDKVVNFKKSGDLVVKAFSFNITAPFVVFAENPIIFKSVAITQTQQFSSYYCDANAPPFFKLYSQYIFYA